MLLFVINSILCNIFALPFDLILEPQAQANYVFVASHFTYK